MPVGVTWTFDEIAYFTAEIDADQVLLLYNSGTGDFDFTEPSATSRGTVRTSDDVITSGALWGHPVRLHSDVGNLRVEFFRTTENPDELPGRYVRAVEDFACASVLSDEGPGQDRALAALYSSRFESAVSRLRKRVNQIRQQRTATIGGQAGRGSTPYARLPQSYPEGA